MKTNKLMNMMLAVAVLVIIVMSVAVSGKSTIRTA